MPIKDFGHVAVVNLDDRPDRMARFQAEFPTAGWPFAPPERFAAIDLRKVPRPVGFSQQAAAWGCLQSHMTLWQEAIEAKAGNLFIFEDDCIFRPDFAERLPGFLTAVPDDWDMIYLGGLHRYCTADQAVKLTADCYRAWGVTGTWSYGISARFLPALLDWFIERPMYEMHHLDRMLCQFQTTEPRPKVYIAYPWLCGMAAGQSDICSRDYMNDHWWDWTPGQDFRTYMATHKVTEVQFAAGQQVGSGTFRTGFDPHFADGFTRL